MLIILVYNHSHNIIDKDIPSYIKYIMDTKICLYYEKCYYDVFSKDISLIVNEFQNINFLLYKHDKNIDRDNICNEYLFLKILNLNKCNECSNYANYSGLCIKHINTSDKIKKIYLDFTEQLCNSTVDKKDNIINYLSEYVTKTTVMKTKLKTIIKHYYYCNKNIYILFLQDNTVVIKDINYHKTNTIFNKNISSDIIVNFKTETFRTMKLIIFLIFLYKKHKYNRYLCSIISSLEDHTVKYIGNSHILYYNIINSKLIDDIELIDIEKSIHINNHCLRFDIYILIKIGSESYHLVIETDENHHYSNTTYDNIKDNFCLQNNISLLRLHVQNKITEHHINFTLFFIEYLINYKKPIYYFSERYIEANSKIRDKITFGINSYKEYIKDDINDIRNLDAIIKFEGGITALIDKFSIKNTFDEAKYIEELKEESLTNKYTIYPYLIHNFVFDKLNH